MNSNFHGYLRFMMSSFIQSLLISNDFISHICICPNYRTKEIRNFDSHSHSHSKIERHWCESCGKGLCTTHRSAAMLTKTFVRNRKLFKLKIHCMWKRPLMFFFPLKLRLSSLIMCGNKNIWLDLANDEGYSVWKPWKTNISSKLLTHVRV